MTLKSGPGLGLLVNADPGEGHYSELTRLLRGIDALVQPNVISRVAAVPTSGMSDGDRYLLTAAPNANSIARYSTDRSPAGWEYYAPRNGWYVWSVADQKGYRFRGTTAAWGEEIGGSASALGTATSSSGTLDLSDASKTIWSATLAANATTVRLPTGMTNPLTLSVILTQDSTGGRTVTWPASVTWLPGSAPVINPTASSRTVVTLVSIDGGTNWLGTYDFQGGTIPKSLAVSGPVRVGQYTLSTLPSASAFSAHEIDVTDATGGAKRCRSNGTNWLILNTTTTVS